MLYREVLRELDALGISGQTVDLVLAALEGERSVEGAPSGESPEVTGAQPTGSDSRIPSAYLRDVTVSGFRGIGPEVTLDIPPGPGLTVVVGRNGSGKSSFAEALEVLLTGDTLRWSDKRGPWKEGWKNLHHQATTRIRARFQVEGKSGPTTARATWSEGSDFAGVRRTVQHHGERMTDLGGVGWEVPLDLFRPLLSYNELGMIGAGPSALFDTLSAVLGLDPLVDARKPLQAVRLKRQRFEKQVKEERRGLLAALEMVQDQRAESAVSALKKRVWDLETLAGLGADPGPEQSALGSLADLEQPDREQVFRVAGEVENSYRELSGLTGTEAEQAQQLAQLLTTALDRHGRHGDEPCPVCGVGSLDSAWRAATKGQIERLRESAGRYQDATRAFQSAMNAARRLVAVPSIPAPTGVDTAAVREAWARWAGLPADPAEVTEHLVAVHESLAELASEVSTRAAALYSEREERWKELSPTLMAWVAKARQAVDSRHEVKLIKDAETALKQVTESLRNARWQPIQAEALTLWRGLRLQSNVDLRSVELTGSGTRRRVELTVKVDGAETSALAVASQGELSCLALSLFFPRAMLDDSPFRFLVIDDPVQAMDPARVDGLARVFADIAKNRQLVVFTHDDRLPESLRRMKIEHTCKKVTRRPGSVVEVSDSHDPVTQHFIDAWAVIQDSYLPYEMAARVIPGFCREGLEAACVEAIRRRLLGRGESHSQVEQILEAANRLSQKAALALFDNMSRGAQVPERISQKWTPGFRDAFRAANRGAHGAYSGDLRQLISECQALAARLRSL